MASDPTCAWCRKPLDGSEGWGRYCSDLCDGKSRSMCDEYVGPQDDEGDEEKEEEEG